MSEGERTPGPWEHHAYDTNDMYELRDEVSGADGEIICCNTPFYPTGITRANARLIAAAPEMLEALENLRACIMETRGPDAHAATKAADAAIAKAKGQDT